MPTVCTTNTFQTPSLSTNVVIGSRQTRIVQLLREIERPRTELRHKFGNLQTRGGSVQPSSERVCWWYDGRVGGQSHYRVRLERTQKLCYGRWQASSKSERIHIKLYLFLTADLRRNERNGRFRIGADHHRRR